MEGLLIDARLLTAWAPVAAALALVGILFTPRRPFQPEIARVSAL